MNKRRRAKHGGPADVSCISPPTLSIPADALRHGTALLNLQCWCWGWDVRRPAGNLLLEHGFTRYRPPDPRVGSSVYTLPLGAGRTVVLWGFGVFYGDAAVGGLYLSRQTFVPQLAPHAEPPSTVWDFNCLPPMRTPHTAAEWCCASHLLVAALEWIAAYEAWVLATHGHAYRHECFVAWRKTKLAAHELPAQWQTIRQHVAHLAQRNEEQIHMDADVCAP